MMSVFNFGRDLLLRLLGRAMQPLLGYNAAPMMVAGARAYGLVRWLRHMSKLTAVLKRLTEAYGEKNAELLCGLAGLWNGCGFCGIGHIRASNLVLFRDEGTLGPIDEADVRDLMLVPYDRQAAELRRLFASSPETLTLALRMFQMRMGVAGDETPHDPALKGCLSAWAWLNECTIAAGLDMPWHRVPVHTEAARDKDLCRRYDAARAPGRA